MSGLENGVLSVEGRSHLLEADIDFAGDLVIAVRCRDTRGYGHCCPATIVLDPEAQELLRELLDSRTTE